MPARPGNPTDRLPEPGLAMHHPARYTTLLALTLLAPPLAAQGHPLEGRWNIELQIGFASKDGETVPLMGTGTLTFLVQGDSIIGTMDIRPGEGQPVRPPARLAAKLGPAPVTFVREGKLTTTQNGELRTFPMTNTYRFEATGDMLTGTVRRDIEGQESPQGGTTPITGTRVKG